MKNKFWLENLKSMIAMGVVGVIVLGLLYWKFFMDTGPAPPPYYMPPPPPPPAPAPAAGASDAGGNTDVMYSFLIKKQRILAHTYIGLTYPRKQPKKQTNVRKTH